MFSAISIQYAKRATLNNTWHCILTSLNKMFIMQKPFSKWTLPYFPLKCWSRVWLQINLVKHLLPIILNAKKAVSLGMFYFWYHHCDYCHISLPSALVWLVNFVLLLNKSAYRKIITNLRLSSFFQFWIVSK